MDPTIKVALIASIASLFGVIVGAVVGFVNQWYTMRKQREQWNLEQQVEHEKWLRDKIQEIYNNCIFFSSQGTFHSYAYKYEIRNKSPELDYEYQKMSFEADKLDAERQLEKRRWLNLLMVYHPFKDTSEYDTFLKKHLDNTLTVLDIRELAEQDPRLKR